jgi:hypothetical protein
MDWNRESHVLDVGQQLSFVLRTKCNQSINRVYRNNI